jgi:UDP-N-acetylglucosamine enolpyruvyl transferase
LSGDIDVAGNKHSLVLALAAAVATGTDLELTNVPDLVETSVLARLVADLGVHVERTPARLRIGGQVRHTELDPVRAQLIHGSSYLLPAVLAAAGEVVFPGSGGDQLGQFDWGLTRPLRHMLEVMEKFGARWERDPDGVVVAKAAELSGASLDVLRWSSDPVLLNGPRVSGATKTAVLMAAASAGQTVIHNPHVQGATTELLKLIAAMGCAVHISPRRWVITPGKRVSLARYTLEADPVEVVYWHTLAALTGSRLRLRVGDVTAVRATLRHELALLDRLGLSPRFDGIQMTTAATAGYPGADLVAQSTGISTDVLPSLVCLMFRATSPSTAVDLVWPGRFQYAGELAKLGLRSTRRANRLSITPSSATATTRWLCPADTRAAASCVLFGLTTPGQTRIAGAHHLYRGHDRFLSKLHDIGADVRPC